MDEYEIPIHGLTEGIHNYDFELKTSFFEFYSNPDLPGGELKVDLCVIKKAQFLEFDFHLTGILDLVCDRCLEVFAFKIDIKEKLFVRFGNKFEELDDNIIVIPREESRFNISQYLYEFAALSIPYKKVHSESLTGESGCDPEMIKRLNELMVEEKIETIDPRWEKLKNLN
jgi:uncharacterized protein